MLRYFCVILLVCACDPGTCPDLDGSTATSTTGFTSITTADDATTGVSPSAVGDACVIDPSVCTGSMQCLLPWGYCTEFCDTDVYCAQFDHEFPGGGGIMFRYTCEAFPGNLSFCFETAEVL